MTLVDGLQLLPKDELKALLKELKNAVAGGGKVDDVTGRLEVQGEHAEKVLALLCCACICCVYARTTNIRAFRFAHVFYGFLVPHNRSAKFSWMKASVIQRFLAEFQRRNLEWGGHFKQLKLG